MRRETAFLLATAAVQPRVRYESRSSGETRTAYGHVRGSNLPSAVTSVQFRRALRPRGALARRFGVAATATRERGDRPVEQRSRSARRRDSGRDANGLARWKRCSIAIRAAVIRRRSHERWSSATRRSASCHRFATCSPPSPLTKRRSRRSIPRSADGWSVRRSLRRSRARGWKPFSTRIAQPRAVLSRSGPIALRPGTGVDCRPPLDSAALRPAVRDHAATGDRGSDQSGRSSAHARRSSVTSTSTSRSSVISGTSSRASRRLDRNGLRSTSPNCNGRFTHSWIRRSRLPLAWDR